MLGCQPLMLLGLVACSLASGHVVTRRAQPRVVGWYGGGVVTYPPEAIDFSVVTHIVNGGITIAANGSVDHCNRSSWPDIQNRLHKLARQSGRKIQGHGGVGRGNASLLDPTRSFRCTTSDQLSFCVQRVYQNLHEDSSRCPTDLRSGWVGV